MLLLLDIHYHQLARTTQISLTVCLSLSLSLHPSQSSIASNRPSKLYPMPRVNVYKFLLDGQHWHFLMYAQVQPLLNVAWRWQRVVSELFRRELRFLVGSPKADWSVAQRYKDRNPAKGALVKIQEVSVPAAGSLGSFCQCVWGKSAANRAFFRVGLGTHPSIKSQSTFFNEQHKQRSNSNIRSLSSCSSAMESRLASHFEWPGSGSANVGYDG